MVKRWLLIYGYPRISRLRNLAKKALRKYGYEILEAENGEKALNVSGMTGLLQECFKIRLLVIVSDAPSSSLTRALGLAPPGELSETTGAYIFLT